MNPRRLMPVFFAAIVVAQADPLPRTFLRPDRIRYDSQCLTIDGRDFFVFSGTFHYFRCPKPLWRDRFQKIKDAGCNTVETYVPWNWHERREPSSPDDFTQIDLTDLKEWMRMAHDEFGLYTIIRPGPYICAEWDGGGFPRWLLNKRPAGFDLDASMANPVTKSEQPGALASVQPGVLATAGSADQAGGHRKPWLRTNDPVFLEWSKHWMEAVCPVVAAEQVTHKPRGHAGVILFQIENEYDLYKEIPDADRAPHLRALCEVALQGGIDVPIFTCWTKECRDSSDPVLSQVFDAFNAYPRFKIESTGQRIETLVRQQPDAPVMISELQGGWFGKVGDLLSEDQPGLTAEQLTAHTLLAIEDGATILNYYVLFGGTNFGLWAGRDDVTSYDYYAPIREPGGVGAKYLAAAAIGQMIREHADEFARSRRLECQSEAGSPDVMISARRSMNGSTYIFVRNRALKESRKGSAVVWLGRSKTETRIDYDLGPMGFKLFRLPAGETEARTGEWLPKAVTGPRRPSVLPAPVHPAEAWMRADPGPIDEVPVPAGALLPKLGVLDARTVVYRSAVSLTPDQAASAEAIHFSILPGDAVALEINGHVVPADDSGGASVAPWIKPGANSIRALYVQAGQANFGPQIEDLSGMRTAILTARTPAASPSITIGGWSVARDWTGSRSGWFASGSWDKSGWERVPLDAGRTVERKGKLADAPAGTAAGLAVWYRIEFKLPAARAGEWIPWRALLDAAGDGPVYLNGQAIGRYWEQGPQREYYLPECWLHFGEGQPNVLTLCLSPLKKGVAVRSVELAPFGDQAEVRGP